MAMVGKVLLATGLIVALLGIVRHVAHAGMLSVAHGGAGMVVVGAALAIVGLVLLQQRGRPAVH